MNLHLYLARVATEMLFFAPLNLLFVVGILACGSYEGTSTIKRTWMYSRRSRTLLVLALELLIAIEIVPITQLPFATLKALSIGLNLGTWSAFITAGLAAAVISPAVATGMLVRIARRPARSTVIGFGEPYLVVDRHR